LTILFSKPPSLRLRLVEELIVSLRLVGALEARINVRS